MYGSAQQSPYLQVALPLIEDVKGGEGLGSLWRVFTKCQSSIQDGSRLENISWRYVLFCLPALSCLLLPLSHPAGRRTGWNRIGSAACGEAGREDDDVAWWPRTRKQAGLGGIPSPPLLRTLGCRSGPAPRACSHPSASSLTRRARRTRRHLVSSRLELKRPGLGWRVRRAPAQPDRPATLSPIHPVSCISVLPAWHLLASTLFAARSLISYGCAPEAPTSAQPRLS